MDHEHFVDVCQEVNMNGRDTSIVGAVHHGTPSSAAPAPSAWMASAETASDHPGSTLVDLCSFTCDGNRTGKRREESCGISLSVSPPLACVRVSVRDYSLQNAFINGQIAIRRRPVPILV